MAPAATDTRSFQEAIKTDKATDWDEVKQGGRITVPRLQNTSHSADGNAEELCMVSKH